MENTVNNLFKYFHPHSIKGRASLTKSGEDCLLEFHERLKTLKKKYIKKDWLDNPEYVLGCLFKDYAKNEKEFRADCVVHLGVAEYCFKKVIIEISKKDGGFTDQNIKSYEDTICTYIHDLKPIIEFLEKRDDPKYVFSEGGRFKGTDTWFAFRHCVRLFWKNSFEKDLVDLNTSLNLSIFLLRQTLELKFRRLIGVNNIYNKTSFAPPKLKQEYFYNFILRNKEYFQFNTLHLNEICKIYRWTNFTIHTGIVPRIWVLQYAIEVVTPFIFPKSVPKGRAWSIHNSVRVINFEELQNKFKLSFYKDYSETDWEIEFTEPEAELNK